jgi:hypothetical protein
MDAPTLTALIDSVFVVLTITLERFVPASWLDYALAMVCALQPLIVILAIHWSKAETIKQINRLIST